MNLRMSSVLALSLGIFLMGWSSPVLGGRADEATCQMKKKKLPPGAIPLPLATFAVAVTEGVDTPDSTQNVNYVVAFKEVMIHRLIDCIETHIDTPPGRHRRLSGGKSQVLV